MKKCSLTLCIVMIMSSNVQAASLLQMTRALASMPIARQLSTAAKSDSTVKATKVQPDNTSPEPIGTDWNEYAQDWDRILDDYDTINYRSNNVQKKVRVLDALARNHKLMVPAIQAQYGKSFKEWAEIGGVFGVMGGGISGVLGLIFLGGLPVFDVFMGSLGCAGLGYGAGYLVLGGLSIPANYLDAKISTDIDRRDYVAHLSKWKELYSNYLKNPKLVSSQYKKGLIELPVGPNVGNQLPRVILQDLYEESKREGLIRE